MFLMKQTRRKQQQYAKQNEKTGIVYCILIA